jgi:hypothetical protein
VGRNGIAPTAAANFHLTVGEPHPFWLKALGVLINDAPLITL